MEQSSFVVAVVPFLYDYSPSPHVYYHCSHRQTRRDISSKRWDCSGRHATNGLRRDCSIAHEKNRCCLLSTKIRAIRDIAAVYRDRDQYHQPTAASHWHTTYRERPVASAPTWRKTPIPCDDLSRIRSESRLDRPRAPGIPKDDTRGFAIGRCGGWTRWFPKRRGAAAVPMGRRRARRDCWDVRRRSGRGSCRSCRDEDAGGGACAALIVYCCTMW